MAAAFFVNGFLLGRLGTADSGADDPARNQRDDARPAYSRTGAPARWWAMPWCGYLIGRVGSRPVLLDLPSWPRPAWCWWRCCQAWRWRCRSCSSSGRWSAAWCGDERQLPFRPNVSSAAPSCHPRTGSGASAALPVRQAGGLVIQHFGHLAHAGAASLIALLLVVAVARHIIEGATARSRLHASRCACRPTR